MLLKRLSILLVIAVLLSLAAGCSSSPTPAPTATSAPKPAATTAPAPTTAAAKPTAAPTAAAKPTAAPAPTSASARVQRWVMPVGSEGSVTYAIAVGMARQADKYLQNTKITVTTGQEQMPRFRLYDSGESNLVMADTLSFRDSWANAGVFAKDPLKVKQYHGFYYLSSIHNVMTLNTRTDINKYGDLAGKKLFPYRTGTGSHSLAQMVFGDQGLGIWSKISDRQVGDAEVSDAMKNGVIDAAWVYIASDALSATWKELDIRVNLKAVEPSADEKTIIAKTPGVIAPVAQKTAGVFTKNVGTDQIWGIAILFAFNPGPREDTESIYQLAKAWFDHPDEMRTIGKFLDELGQRGSQLTVAAINSMPDIPVHPGVAKYLKEKGQWNDKWKIGELTVK